MLYFSVKYLNIMIDAFVSNKMLYYNVMNCITVLSFFVSAFVGRVYSIKKIKKVGTIDNSFSKNQIDGLIAKSEKKEAIKGVLSIFVLTGAELIICFCLLELMISNPALNIYLITIPFLGLVLAHSLGCVKLFI